MIVAVLAGCTSGPQGAQTPPGGITIPRNAGAGQLSPNSLNRLSVTERLIHSFGAAGDGFGPEAALIDVNGIFYGTTTSGPAQGGYGTVFKIAPSGKETLLHAFDFTDGSGPVAKLTNVNGTLYGTTSFGGANNHGTVFTITQSGKLATLYNFAGGSDGSDPSSGLISLNGTLYGTTYGGGTHGGGTVYSITTTGHETVRYNFGDKQQDGYGPLAGLVKINGTLYGTTEYGGSNALGTVFSVTASGDETVLHRFSGPPDGYEPMGGLTNVNGTIYGTTSVGGTYDLGTVFSMTTSGDEKVLYSFAGSPDGRSPMATLLNVNGILYGTTSYGGVRCQLGCGVVFSITTSGEESVIYSFKGRGTGHPDGKYPSGGLVHINETLYGTTSSGGAYTGCGQNSGGCGTVFEVTP